MTWITEICNAKQQIIFPHEYIPARPVILFLDHPVHEAEAIKVFEARSAQRQDVAPPLYGIMDQDHLTFLLDQGISTDRVFPFPQGGPPANPNALPICERPIDIIFHGNIPDPESELEFFDRLGMADPKAQELMREVIDLVLHGEADPYGAARLVLKRLGYDAPVAAARMAIDVDLRTRRLRRWQFLSNLKDLNVVFCGDISHAFQKENPNGLYWGPKSFVEIMELVKRSKIMLNETINLRHAALFRLHYAMAEGCVVASQRNSGLERHFQDDENILLLNDNADDGLRLRALLSAPDRLQRMADNASIIHSRHHSWDNRLQPLLAIPGTKH